MLSEQEILDRHRQSIGDAARACQEMGRNARDDYAAPRGPHYRRLCEALDLLEGSAQQMAAFREDARWTKFGIHYAKVARMCQTKYMLQHWAFFNELLKVFAVDLKTVDELNLRTGVKGPILPARPSDFLVMPDHKVPYRRGTAH